MLTNKAVEEKLKDYFQGRVEIKAAYLFGSVASGMEREGSDVDLALLTDPIKDKMESYKTMVLYQTDISRLLKRNIDLIFLHEAGELLSFEILNIGKIIFERDREANRSFMGIRLAQCLDFKFLEDRMRRGMISAMRMGSIGS